MRLAGVTEKAMTNMVEIVRLNIEDIDLEDEREVDTFHEAWIASGQSKVQDDFRRLREMGIVDACGQQVKTVVPADMLDSNADFDG